LEKCRSEVIDFWVFFFGGGGFEDDGDRVGGVCGFWVWRSVEVIDFWGFQSSTAEGKLKLKSTYCSTAWTVKTLSFAFCKNGTRVIPSPISAFYFKIEPHFNGSKRS
jgi:hypothetical protein